MLNRRGFLGGLLVAPLAAKATKLLRIAPHAAKATGVRFVSMSEIEAMYIRPAMLQLANSIDTRAAATYQIRKPLRFIA